MFETLTAKLVALGIVVAMTIAGWMYVTGLQDKVAQLEKDKIVLIEKSEACSASVLALKKNAEKRASDNDKLVKEADERAKNAEAKARRYYTAKPSSPDNCKAALDLINKGVE